MLNQKVINKFVLKLEDAYKYAFCPARLVLEHNSTYRGNRGLNKYYTRTKFEAYRHVFNTMIRYYELGKEENKILSQCIGRAIKQFKDILLPEDSQLSASIVTAYHIKMFQGLIKYLDADSVNTVGSVYVPISESNVIDLFVDLSYMKRVDGVPVIGYVILVPEEEWNEIDLANRFENTLLNQFVSKSLSAGLNTKTEIVFYNISQCKVYKVDKFSNTGWNLNRLDSICEKIKNKDLAKQPLGIKCRVCPVKSKCITSSIEHRCKKTIGAPLFVRNLPSSSTGPLLDEELHSSV